MKLSLWISLFATLFFVIVNFGSSDARRAIKYSDTWNSNSFVEDTVKNQVDWPEISQDQDLFVRKALVEQFNADLRQKNRDKENDKKKGFAADLFALIFGRITTNPTDTTTATANSTDTTTATPTNTTTATTTSSASTASTTEDPSKMTLAGRTRRTTKYPVKGYCKNPPKKRLDDHEEKS